MPPPPPVHQQALASNLQGSFCGSRVLSQCWGGVSNTGTFVFIIGLFVYIVFGLLILVDPVICGFRLRSSQYQALTAALTLWNGSYNTPYYTILQYDVIYDIPQYIIFYNTSD